MAINKKDLLIKKKPPIDIGLRPCTQGLFYEYNNDKTTCKIVAPYTLQTIDIVRQGIAYKSMYLIYIRCDSEYEAAMKLVINYQQWRRLKRAGWFNVYLDEWNEEIALREKALAKSTLISLAEEGNVTAARTLLDANKAIERKERKQGYGSEKDDVLSNMLKSAQKGKPKPKNH